MPNKPTRRGFTLVEILVTVTIVAVLAAVMVPAVINQVAKGDVPSVGQDIAGVRTAVTTFAADTRRFPLRLSQLGGATLATTAQDITFTAYGTDNANYHGPYASLTAGHAGPTGALFSDSLTNTNPAGTPSRSICMRDSTSAANNTGSSYITPAQLSQLEAAVDNDSTNSTTRANGSVTWTQTSPSGVVTITAGTVRVCVTTY